MRSPIWTAQLLIPSRFSDIPKDQPVTSAHLIEHPEKHGEAVYKVEVLQPAPAPLPASHLGTPAASHAPTPRSEPTHAIRYISVREVTSIFLKSLVQSASDFLGKPILGSVITVPPAFTPKQKEALLEAAGDAGIKVLQLLEEPGAVAATTSSAVWASANPSISHDRTQLIVDLGQHSLTLTVLSLRHGLAHILSTASHYEHELTGEQIDDKLIKFFAKEFTKKTKVALAVCPSTHAADKRAEAKLRLAVEHTKRTLSASPGAATCSVESLRDGADYTGSINRMRFDMEVRTVYVGVAKAILELLSSATPPLDSHEIDEVVYVGGSTSLPGLDEHLSDIFREDIISPFKSGTVLGGGVGDPTEVMARGCAVQAELLHSLHESDDQIRSHFEKVPEMVGLNRTIGIVIPHGGEDKLSVGGTWVPLVHRETVLPARRVVSFEVGVEGDSGKIGLEVWEVSEGIRIEKITPPKAEPSSDDEDDDEPEEEEVKHKTVKKESFLGKVEIAGTKGKGSKRRVEVKIVIGKDGAVHVTLQEQGSEAVGELRATT